MCDCLNTLPKSIAQTLQNQGVDIQGMPYIASRECFKGDFYYRAVALETVLFQKYKKRNGEIGTKKVKKPLIPKFCPFCGEMYVKEQK